MVLQSVVLCFYHSASKEVNENKLEDIDKFVFK